LNRRSRAPGARGIPGFPTSCWLRAPSGSRTRTSAMARRQAAATSWALRGSQIVKDQEHREGIEPTPYGLKVRRAASYTTTPRGDRAYAFQSTKSEHHLAPVCWVVSGSDQSGIHADRCPNRTQHNAVISRVWTTSPRLPCSPEALIFHLHLSPNLLVLPCGRAD
jgi:hypothetical protein